VLSLELHKFERVDMAVVKAINITVIGISFLSLLVTLFLYGLIYPAIFSTPNKTLIRIFNIYRKLRIVQTSLFLFTAIYLTVFMLISLSGIINRHRLYVKVSPFSWIELILLH